MRRLEEQFSEELVVIGVHSAKFPSEKLTGNIRQAVMRLGIDHPVVNDAGFQIWSAYNVNAWPTLVLIDPTGRIAGETAGEISGDEMAVTIQALIDEHAGEIDRSPLPVVPEERLLPDQTLRFPANLLVVESGQLFISDSGHHRVIQVQLDADGSAGEIRRIFGSGQPGLRNGSASQAEFQHPRGIALKGNAESGIIYVADTDNHAIRAIELGDGSVRTVAGTGEKAAGRYPVGSPLETPLRSPWDLLIVDQYLLIAMAGSHQIWVLIDEQQLGVFAGNGREALVDGTPAEASFNQPSGLAFGYNYVFVADPEASAIRAISVSEQPKVITLAGQGLFDFGDKDGPGEIALLQHPSGIAVSEKTLAVADTYNHKIKMLDLLTGEVNSLAGTGQPGHRDGPFEQAMFYEPEGIKAASDRLWVADTNNHEIRILDLPTRKVQTVQLRSGMQNSLPGLVGGAVQAGPFVVQPGPVQLTIDLELPPGYHRNPDAPSYLQPSGGDQHAIEFKAGQDITWTVDGSENRPAVWNLTVYYCTEDGSLCKVAEQSIQIELQPGPDGSSEVYILVRIEA